ncbi:MAG: GGDEF domain-containing protein [Deltaproteobacteria bacterium]|nr:GGDEF domain-containing protein [Deltaproteobacteria bacterium]
MVGENIRSAVRLFVLPPPSADDVEVRAAVEASDLRRVRVLAGFVALLMPVFVAFDAMVAGLPELQGATDVLPRMLVQRGLVFAIAVTLLVLSRGTPPPRRSRTLVLASSTTGVLAAAVFAVTVQRVRPDIAAFLLAAVAIAATVRLRGRVAFLVFLPGWAVLVAGLYLYQPDPVLRSLHVASGTVGALLSILVSRMLWAGAVREEGARIRLERRQQELMASNRELGRETEKLRRLTFLDATTGIPNRRYFDEAIEREASRAGRERQPVAVLMADIDHFKPYNDSLGHQAGDTCLSRVAAALAGAALRPGDLVARFGGEEFAVVLPDTTLTGARIVAERMRRAVEGLAIRHPGADRAVVTISLGVAAGVASGPDSGPALVSAADAALYRAKSAGRNRVESTA